LRSSAKNASGSTCESAKAGRRVTAVKKRRRAFPLVAASIARGIHPCSGGMDISECASSIILSSVVPERPRPIMKGMGGCTLMSPILANFGRLPAVPFGARLDRLGQKRLHALAGVEAPERALPVQEPVAQQAHHVAVVEGVEVLVREWFVEV
jgi:hypothetical protein